MHPADSGSNPNWKIYALFNVLVKSVTIFLLLDRRNNKNRLGLVHISTSVVLGATSKKLSVSISVTRFGEFLHTMANYSKSWAIF